MSKLAKHYSEAKYSRSEKRWTFNTKRARQASKAFNKADRKATKLALSNY
jgi:hypothetical protein